MRLHLRGCSVEFAEITGCLNGVVRVHVFIHTHVYARCICRARATEYVRGYSRVYTCISRFAIAARSPSHSSLSCSPHFSFHVPPTIQFIRWIILGTSCGTEGGFQPSPFLIYLVVAPVRPSFYVPASHCWLNRHGRYEGACPRQRFELVLLENG